MIGPLARSADDLELALDVVAGPDHGLDAWRLNLPPARHAQLEEFRVAVLPPADWRPVDIEIAGTIDVLGAELRRHGARVETTLPVELGDLREHHEQFQTVGTATTPAILNAIFHPGERTTPPVELTDQYRRERAAAVRAGDDPFAEAVARGIECTAADFIGLHDRRERYRAIWRQFFRDWDMLLAPIVVIPAPPHSTEPFHRQTANVNGRTTGLRYAMAYASLPIVSGLPATAFSIGMSRDGLPIGIQAIGPFLEDRTPIKFVRLVAQQLGGFRQPPNYDD